MKAFKVPHVKRQGMSPPGVVQGRVPVQFGPNPATGGPLPVALGLVDPRDSEHKKRPCPKDTFKVLSVRHWGIRPFVWSRGGSLCSLVPMQWLEGCQTGAFSSARLLWAKKRPCPAEAFKVTPMKHWSIQPLIWARQGSLGSLVPIQLLDGPLLLPPRCGI